MGLVTSHPHAVLALEKATQQLVTYEVTTPLAHPMMMASSIPYFKDAQASPALLKKCMVNTQFYADHTEVEGTVAQSTTGVLGGWSEGMSTSPS